MTILAGVFTRDSRGNLADTTCANIRQQISRNPSDSPIEFRFPRAFLVKVDIGAFGRPGCRTSPGGPVAMLAGEPLLTGEGHVDAYGAGRGLLER